MILSIITINFNNAYGLKKTIESIIPHTHEEIEYIVIDGASADNSIDIIQQYSDKIDHWVSEPDFGIYNAMNKGIRQAKGEYVLFINSGDTIQSGIEINEILKQLTGEDIIYYNLEIVDTVSGMGYIKEYPDSPDFKYFMEDTLPHTASFIKKKMLVEYGYYSEKMKIVSDWAFYTDCVCLKGCTYKHINDCFSTFYLDGVSSDQNNRQALLAERADHVRSVYPLYYSLYTEWLDKKDELYRLKTSASVRFLKKIGFLKWLKL